MNKKKICPPFISIGVCSVNGWPESNSFNSSSKKKKKVKEKKIRRRKGRQIKYKERERDNTG